MGRYSLFRLAVALNWLQENPTGSGVGNKRKWEQKKHSLTILT